MYTDQEYNANLVNETWTREDTDLLLKTAEKYSERWPIVHDNWLQDSRTVNDLIARYASVHRAILSARGHSKYEIEQYAFDLAHANNRKLDLERLYSRSAEQVQEEEFLLIELHQFALAQDEWNRSRDSSLKTHTIHETTNSKANVDTKKRKPDGHERQRTKKEYDDLSVKRDRLPAGIHPRTSRLVYPRTANTAAVQTILEGFGIGLRPVMPTESVCMKYEELFQLLQCTIEASKAEEKAEIDLRAAQSRKEKLIEELNRSGPHAAQGSHEIKNSRENKQSRGTQ